MRISLACSLPSGPIVPPEAMKSPGLISATVFLTLIVIRVADVTCAVGEVPSVRAKEIDFPSKDLMVPVTAGVISRDGGIWAKAGRARRTVAQNAGVRIRMMISLYSA